MSLEIERKFRIKMPEKDWLRSREAVTVTGLVQCYLTAHEGWERRGAPSHRCLDRRGTLAPSPRKPKKPV